jgi:replicative DNA helicase
MEIEYTHNGSEVRSNCPIHCGDNAVAWSWSFTHNSWRCWTRDCHEEHGTDIIGFIRGVQKYSFQKALKFLSDFLQGSIKTRKRKITPVINKKPGMNFPLSEIVDRITLDDQYYINRGLSAEIIKRYHIGICDNRNKKFYKRVVIPVLSDDGKYVVGFTARSIFEQCDKCKGYHDPNYRYCPHKPEIFSKWKHSGGFARNNFLYNYWFSQHYIRQSQTAILVEGPGDCLALEQAGIHNSVGLFGLSLSSKQKTLLQKAGAVHIVLCMDNDEAGCKASEKLEEDLSYYFKISTTSLSAKDIGEMKPDQIRSSLCCKIN